PTSPLARRRCGSSRAAADRASPPPPSEAASRGAERAPRTPNRLGVQVVHWCVVRPLVMGILNVTPDPFSDGGSFTDAARAVDRGHAIAAEGADWVDVGGESTRPGAQPVPEDEELRRVVPVVEALADAGLAVSVDTRKEAVARAAVAAGAQMVNDVSATLGHVAADLGVAWVAMHARGEPATMQLDPRYDDVVAEVLDHLVRRAEAALAAGAPEVWIDPGIGFGKTAAHNLTLLAHLDVLVA